MKEIIKTNKKESETKDLFCPPRTGEMIKGEIIGIGKSAVTLLTSKGKHTILKTPTQKLPSYDAKKIIMKGERQSLVREGRTGFFNKEMVEETKWLS